MFAEVLRQFKRIVSMLLTVISGQAAIVKLLLDIGQEQRRQAAVLEEIRFEVTLPVADRLTLTGDVEGVITTGDQKMRMFESQKGTLTLEASNSKTNKPARIDGKPAWTVQQNMATAVNLNVAEDGMSAEVVANEFGADDPNVKSLSILVTADADLGEGVRELQASASIELVRSEADVLSLKEGPVTDQ